MKSIRSFAAVAAAAFVIALSAAPALAGPGRGDGNHAYGYYGRGHEQAYRPFRSRGHRPPPRPVVHVPEIDAASGLAALAAVCGALAFAWERRRHS